MSSPSSPRRTTPVRVAGGAAAVAFTVVLAAGASVVAVQRLSSPSGPAASALTSGPLSASASASARTSTLAARSPKATLTRLAVQGPRRLLDPNAGGVLAAGAQTELSLPALPAGTSAVLLQLSLLGARGPGTVTLRSTTEQSRVLQLASAGGQASATVVVGIGADRRLLVRTEGGGRLQVDLVAAFEPATRATSGRVVLTARTALLQLKPAQDGNDATIALKEVPALRAAPPVSALLIEVSGDVGRHGGYVSVGPSVQQLDQSVYWAAASGQDRVRPGFLVVPVRSGLLHVRYHAGSRLRVELVGYVTGDAAPAATAGLTLPVTADAATAPVTVTADGQVDVTLLQPAGIAGLEADRVSAAMLSVTATGATAGGVAVDAPGTDAAGLPDLSAGPTGRSALTLARVVAGAVQVASDAPAVVVLTPRVLVLGG